MAISIEDADRWLDEITSNECFNKAYLEYIKEESNKPKAINPIKFKIFVESAAIIKEYFKKNSNGKFKMNINLTDITGTIGNVIVYFENVNIVNGEDLKELAKNFSYVELAVTDDNNPSIEFGFRGLMNEL